MKFLLAALLFVSFTTNAQTRLSSTFGTGSQSPIITPAGVPLDARSYYCDTTNYKPLKKWYAFDSYAQATAWLTDAQKLPGVEQWIDSTFTSRVNGVKAGGKSVKFVYDANKVLQLAEFDSTSISNRINTKLGINDRSKYSVDILPSLSATGAGTEASPFLSADGTAGLNTTIGNLTRGGNLRLPTAAYQITGKVNMNKHAMGLTGDIAGFNIDPNGEAEGASGTKLRMYSGASIVQGIQGARLGNQILDNLYMFGPGIPTNIGNVYDTITPAINVVANGLDQAHYNRLNISNFPVAIAGTTGNFDTPYFTELNVLNAGFGIYLRPSGTTSYNVHVSNSTLADLDYSGAWFNSNGGDRAYRFQGNTVWRNNRVYQPGKVNTGLYFGPGGIHGDISGNDIAETGRNSINPSQSNITDANGLVIDGQREISITNNHIYSNEHGNGIVIRNSENIKLVNNIFQGRNYSNTPGETKNLRDIFIDPTSIGTVVVQSGDFTYADYGVRSIICGMSYNSGNPDSTGQWFNVAKPEGLKIIDTLSGTLYEYSKYYGRRIIATGLTYTNPNTSTGVFANAIDITPASVVNVGETSTGSKKYQSTNATTGYGHTLLANQKLASGQTGYVYAKYTNTTGPAGRSAALLFRDQNVNAGWQNTGSGNVLGFTVSYDGFIYWLKNGNSGPVGSGSYIPSGQSRYIRIYRDAASGSFSIDISTTDPATTSASWTPLYNSYGITNSALLSIVGDVEYNASADTNGQLDTPKGVNVQ